MSASEATDLTDVRTFGEGFPHAFFERLRDESPLYWHAPTVHTPDGEGFWVVSRYDDVLNVFLDVQTWSSEGGGERRMGGTFIQDLPFAGLMLNMMDDPRHARIRSLVNKGFTPRRIAALREDLRARAARIVARVAERGECEFVRDVARELPLQAICSIMGIPAADRDMLCDWVDIGLEAPGEGASEGRISQTEATRRLRAYAADLIAEKRRHATEDVLSVVVHARLPDDDPPALTDDELGHFFFLLFTAGSETTRKTIAGGLRALIEHPDQMRWLRSQEGIPRSAVEELVRWTTPSAYKRRTVTRRVVLHGRELSPGDKITIWEMSANRDAKVFERPGELDLRRAPNPHLAFGHGVHYCLGANLARLEIEVLFEELLARLDRFELAGPPVHTRHNRLFGLSALPVRFEAVG